VTDTDHSAGADDHEGAGLVNLAFAGTGAVVVVGVSGALAPDTFGGTTAFVSGVLFVIGVVCFLWGYATGVVRSRDEQVTLGGLFFLSGTAPKVVRFRLRLALLVQVMVAVAVAAVRPYTSVAFVVLAPMFGLGLLAMWGARHGSFAPKDER
jgi:hypothetical protein